MAMGSIVLAVDKKLDLIRNDWITLAFLLHPENFQQHSRQAGTQ